MYRIIGNPFYYGEFRYPHNGELYKGKHEKIVTKEEFSKIQDILHGRYPTRCSKHIHKYTGLFTCSKCGCAITAEPPKKTEVYYDRYKYYRCTHKKGNCGGKYTTQEDIEAFIKADLEKIFLPKEIVTIIKKHSQKEVQLDGTDELHLAEKQMSLLQKKKEKLLDIFLEGQITEEEYQQKKKALEKDISDLAGRIKPKISPQEKKINETPQVVDLEKYENLNNEVRKSSLKEMYENMSYYNSEFVLEPHPLLKIFYDVPSEIRNEYYQVRTQKNVDMEAFIERRIEESTIWGG